MSGRTSSNVAALTSTRKWYSPKRPGWRRRVTHTAHVTVYVWTVNDSNRRMIRSGIGWEACLGGVLIGRDCM